MTNAQIIMSNRLFLMEQGVIKGIPGTSMTIKDENGERTVLIPEEIRTYDDWKREGRQVVKGQKNVARFKIWMPKKAKAVADADVEADEDAPKGFYKKLCFFFTIEQTEPKKEDR